MEAGWFLENWLSSVKPAPLPLTPTAQGGWLLIGNSNPRHRVVEFLAIPAKNGLDEKVQSAIRAARDFGAVSAFGALKPIRPAHVSCDSHPGSRTPAFSRLMLSPR